MANPILDDDELGGQLGLPPGSIQTGAAPSDRGPVVPRLPGTGVPKDYQSGDAYGGSGYGDSGTGLGQQPPSNPQPIPGAVEAKGPSPEDQAAYDRWLQRVYDAKHAPAGGGGGGGGGAKATGTATPVAPPPGDDFSNFLKTNIQGIIDGSSSRYNPAAMDALRAKIVKSERGQERTRREAIYQDAARRGMFRSPNINPRLDESARSASTNISTGFQGLEVEKARADMEDRLNAVNSGLQWLQSLRNYVLGSDRNAIDKQIAEAQIKLGYAQLSNQKDLLNMQLNARGGGGGGGTDYNSMFMQEILKSIIGGR